MTVRSGTVATNGLAMKLACVREIAAPAKAEASDEVAAAFQARS